MSLSRGLVFVVCGVFFLAAASPAHAQVYLEQETSLSDPVYGRILASGLDVDPASGTAYAVGFNDNGQVILARIAEGSGAFTTFDLGRAVLPLGHTFPVAFDPQSNEVDIVGYTSGHRLLARVNPDTGAIATVPISNLPNIEYGPSLLAFDPSSGKLDLFWNLDYGQVNLLVLDPTTGTALSNSHIPVGAMLVTAVGSDPSAQTLYAAGTDQYGQFSVVGRPLYGGAGFQVPLGRTLFPQVVAADAQLGQVYAVGTNGQGQMLFATIDTSTLGVETADLARTISPVTMRVDPATHEVLMTGTDDTGRSLFVTITNHVPPGVGSHIPPRVIVIGG